MKPIMVLLMALALPAFMQAQQRLPINEVLKQADVNNLNLQAIKKETSYWRALQTGVFDPAKTVVGGEYGNINSAQEDTRFFINQSFNLPHVYRKRQAYYSSAEEAQQQMSSWKQAELNREVKFSFYRLIDLLERKKLMLQIDSIYSKFQQAAALRLETGESNILEKTTADAQLQQLQVQQQQTAADITIEQKKLQWLLNINEPVLPSYELLKMPDIVLPDTADVKLHPQVKYNELQEKSAAAQTAIEKSKLSPDITAGYSNQSLVGYQSLDGVSEKYYGPGKRFHIASLSLGIPLFNAAAKARIKAGKVNEEIAKLSTRATEQQLKTELQQLIDEYKKQQMSIRYYEQTGLQQAKLIIQSARLSFEKGEISYLEWTVLMNNAISIQMNYLDAVYAYNQVIIAFEYLTTKQ